MNDEVATRPTGVTCGVAGCRRNLWRTFRPAGSLWCPDHGHVVDVFPSPPLRGFAIVCRSGLKLDGRSARCEVLDLGDLEARR